MKDWFDDRDNGAGTKSDVGVEGNVENVLLYYNHYQFITIPLSGECSVQSTMCIVI